MLEDFIDGRLGISIVQEELEDILKLAPIFISINAQTDDGSEDEQGMHQFLTGCYDENWEIIFMRSPEKMLDAWKADGAERFKLTHGLVSLSEFIASEIIEVKEIEFMNMFE